MDAAQAADRALATGGPIGPLHGVPVTIKDHEAVRGMQIEYGTYLRRGEVAAADNAMVARLRGAGAIILGKTTTPEFGWMGVSNSPLTGITHNPWKHGMNAGASSAGAGVGAAAGYGPLHQGSDGAGSIRMPAHFSGVFGLKPTYGRVPQSPVAASDHTVHLGPLTRTVADAALMLQNHGRPASRRSHQPRSPARRLSAPSAPAPARAAPRLQPGPRSCPRRPGGGRSGRQGGDRLREGPGLARRAGEDAVGSEGPRARALLLAGAFPAPRRSPARVPRPHGSGLRRLHRGRLEDHHGRLSEDAAGEVRLLRRDQPLLRRLGFPADARGVGRGLPGRAAAAQALAAASVGLAVVGRVLLPLQPVAESRRRRCPAASPGTACRSACRSSAGGSTISACCRCRRRSRRRGRGRRSGRRSIERRAKRQVL